MLRGRSRMASSTKPHSGRTRGQPASASRSCSSSITSASAVASSRPERLVAGYRAHGGVNGSWPGIRA